MFDPGTTPRVFALPPGVDFPAALIAGLAERLDGQPPHAIASVDLIVNTRRMARRLRDLYDQGPPGFLPRIHLLTELDGMAPDLAPPPATPGLRRRLELTRLITGLLDADPAIAPRASLYDLADSLAKLIDEMQGEGVSAETIAALDVRDQSGHWARAQQFLGIAHHYLEQMGDTPDSEARQRQMVERLTAHWLDAPPENPVIIAGSTGSRGTTSMLMQAVARLPQGALVLPGFDFDMPLDMCGMLQTAAPPEDHPQYRFFDLMRQLDLSRSAILPWTEAIAAPAPSRNALVSLSLRPAPVTDTWLSEGPKLRDLDQATADLTLIEAPSPRTEALCIAMGLRKAVEEGRTAALITPDRMLTRQVTSALDRWNILPDDSAGTPLHLSPPGRFLRHVAGLFRRKMDSEALLTLLKHPLTHSGTGRNDHQLNVQRLDLQIRQDGLPYPDRAGLLRAGTRIAARLNDPDPFQHWLFWVCDVFCDDRGPVARPLVDWVTAHLALADRIAAGATLDAAHELWRKKAGRKAREVMANLEEHGVHGGEMSASDYADLIDALLSGEEVRDVEGPHPQIMIWGTLEARVQGADLVILGGLNDGIWPEAPPPDPWLNRKMRHQAGLLLPERRIGLSAHDYQQAIGAAEVWLTRAIRSDEAETVPSRWLNRLENLMNGLPDAAGAEAWAAMKARGDVWLRRVEALESFDRVAPAPRPSPRPPLAARPRSLSVTEIKRLIRDPYAIYAKHVLRLKPLNPLVRPPDALVRGIVVHRVMEVFIKSVVADPSRLTRSHLMATTERVLQEDVPWPAARLMWYARIERIADWFVAQEKRRQAHATPLVFEKAAEGTLNFPDLGFTLRGFADRIDRADDGAILIYDYKTGTPPGPTEQAFFDKQLLLEAAMVEQGGFETIGAAPVESAIFIGLGGSPKEVAAPLDDEPPAVVIAGLRSLIASYLSPDQGFTARRLVQRDADTGDYDQLARYGEWDGTTPAVPEDLT